MNAAEIVSRLCQGGFDLQGCYELPDAVVKALEQEGYDLSEL